MVLHPLKYPARRRSLIDLYALRDIPYMLYGGGLLTGYMGIYVVLYYMQLYAAASAADISPLLAAYLLALINAGSSVARVLGNFAADYVGTLNIQLLFVAVAAALSFALMTVCSASVFVMFCVLYGFFTGTFVSLATPTAASLSPDLAVLGGRMSMVFMTSGVGLLVGPPAAGAILTAGGGENWKLVMVWSGGCLVLATLCMLAARVVKVGWKVKRKA